MWSGASLSHPGTLEDQSPTGETPDSGDIQTTFVASQSWFFSKCYTLSNRVKIKGEPVLLCIENIDCGPSPADSPGLLLGGADFDVVIAMTALTNCITWWWMQTERSPLEKSRHLARSNMAAPWHINLPPLNMLLMTWWITSAVPLWNLFRFFIQGPLIKRYIHTNLSRYYMLRLSQNFQVL